MERYFPPVDEKERMLQRRVADAVKAASHAGAPRVTGFLNEREQQLAKAQLQKQRWTHYAFGGGHEDAERRMLCVCAPDTEPVFPICAVRVDAPGGAGLDHRDYLGAMLATGLKRECIGDILTEDTGAQVFLQSNKLEYLRLNLRSVGRASVAVEELPAENREVPETKQAERFTASVASLRLDAVLAAMLHVSRREAQALVEKGGIQVNHLQIQSAAFLLQQSDLLSVRGEGRYRLDAVGGISRKKRTYIEYLKF